MKIKITGKNIIVTEAIKNYASEKVSKLDKYFSKKGPVDTRILVRTYKTGAKAEITIFLKDTILRAEVYNDDLYAALDLVVDKLEGQIRKLKTKLERRHHERGLGEVIVLEQIEAFEAEERDAPQVREKFIFPEQLSLDEAIFQMEALGHSFFIYRDLDNKNIFHTVYKKDDGSYGVLTTN